MRVMHEVTSCEDCPLYGGTGSSDDGGDTVYCGHPSGPDILMRDEDVPDACPLRKGGLLLQLQARST